MNDARVMWAIRIVFAVAVLLPPALVFIYRFFGQVACRRRDILKMMQAAEADEKSKQDLCQALANNPYISRPEDTFKYYHRLSRYALPFVILVILTFSASYIVYRWTADHLRTAGAVTAPAPSGAANNSAPGASPVPGGPASGQPPTAPKDQAQAAAGSVASRLPLPVIMALAGAYIWSLFQICLRVRSSELLPDDLYEINLGMLAAVPIGLAFSFITSEAGEVRSFMAFAASAFPMREVTRMVRQYASKKILDSTTSSTSRPAELNLGNAVDGLSDDTLSRLGELRIATVLDMAYCDPIAVMVQSGFPLPIIVDWMDQSLWALYAGDLKPKINKCGIRCSLDVCEFVDMHLRDNRGEKKDRDKLTDGDKEALEALATSMGTPASLLYDLLFRIAVDPQVVLLRKLWYPRGVPTELTARAKAAAGGV